MACTASIFFTRFDITLFLLPFLFTLFIFLCRCVIALVVSLTSRKKNLVRLGCLIRKILSRGEEMKKRDTMEGGI